MTESPKLHALAPRFEVTRRDAIKLFAAGVAALEAGCMVAAGDEEIVPYVVDPPEARPGTLLRYASAFTLDGFGTGVIVDTREGRPIKLDGNPAHPASLGGSSPILQAQILDLYDPHRSRDITMDGTLATWTSVLARLRDGDKPLWFVMPPQSSPTLRGLIERLGKQREVHVVYDAPLDHRAVYRGHALAFGRPLEHQPELARADVIVALDSDFMACGPMGAAWARAAAARRIPTARMSRLWVCEPMPTPTGTLADERLAIPARDIAAVAICVLDRLRGRGLPVPRLDAMSAIERLGVHAAWVASLADDLVAHRGAVAVMVGDRQPPIVHALARWIEHACGTPIACSEPALIDPLDGTTLDELMAAAMTAAAVVVIDCDPIYTSSRASLLAEALASAPFSVHLGRYQNATSRACAAHVPLAHELETWTDCRAYDGTLAIGQPAIRPRFEVISAIDVFAALVGDHHEPHALVQDQFRAGGAPPDRVVATWTEALRTGVVANTRAPVTNHVPAWPAAAAAELARTLVPAGAIEIALARSQVHDGRFAPNAWLQELPHPITKQTWGNAALMSAATAARLGVDNEAHVAIITAGGEVTLPALVVTGAADESITIELGYGQLVPATPIADRVGANAYPLRTDDRFVLDALALAAGGRTRIVRTQHTVTEEGRELAPITTLDRFLATPDTTAHLRGEQVSLLPTRSRVGVQWGMSIDTTICTGCSSCMIACQAENNIPVIGPDDVERGRHMSWIRIDRYLVDDGAHTVNEPMLCQHCENAPCEYVCPVMATEHSPDGLNEQVYNRCIGTRFCSNNCPYKVRRFNWFAYEANDDRELQYNPDVTVRSRGVMEKCTYCVQRIRRAEHAALVDKRAIRPGEVVTACQQACPTGAIQFGELHEADTLFARMRRDPRRFEALFDLGTRPRTEYLAKIRNPRGSV